ncbi:hypothetical protein ABPG72_007971 [Tetrahymena utriculariae]
MKLNTLKKEPLIGLLQVNTNQTEINSLQQSKTLTDFNHTQENQAKLKASHRDIQKQKINFTNTNMSNSQGMHDLESLISNEYNSPQKVIGNNNNNVNLEILTNFANSQNTLEIPFYDKIYDSPQYQTERNNSRVRHKRNFARQDQQLQIEMQLSLPQNELKDTPKISIFGKSSVFNNQPVAQTYTNTGQIQQISKNINDQNSFIEQHINEQDLEANNNAILRKCKSPLQSQSIMQESMNKTSQNFLLKSSKQVQKKLDFAEGDDYFYFDPKAKINDLITHQAQIESQSPSQVQFARKTILKYFQKPVSVSESQKLKKQISTSDFDDLQIENNSKINVIKSDSNLESIQSKKEETVHQINSKNILKINQRARQGIIISSDYNLEYLINQNNFSKAKFNSKIKVLNDYEKASYMRRASDINKLIQFQKKNSNLLKQKIEQNIKIVFNFIKKIFCFQIWTETYPSFVNAVQQAQLEVNNIQLNIAIIGLLIFLYSIIQLYNHPSYASNDNLENHIFLDNQYGYLAYSGHLFLLLFILVIIKLCYSYEQYSSKKEQPSVSLIFSELKWNGQRKQIKFLLKKAQLIDQIYENIENNEKFDISQQFALTVFIEMLILISDSTILYYILDDNQFFRIANELTQNNYFLSSFIVSLLISTLMELNNYFLQIIFSCFSKIEFGYFEKIQYYLIFLNQIFIIIVFQIKIIAYLNSDYNFFFSSLKINDKFQISYLNFTLILSQIVVHTLVRLLSLFYEKMDNLVFKGEGRMQIKIIRSSTIHPYQHDPQSNKEILQEYPYSKQKVVTTDAIQNQLIINNQEKIDNINSSNGNIVILKEEKAQNQKNVSFDKMINSDLCKEYPQESNQQFILKAQLIIREVIFLITINYLVICNSILQPSIYGIGLAINIIYIIIKYQQRNGVFYYLSLLNYNQFKSINLIFCLISLLFSFFFNFIVGLNIEPQNISYKSLFAFEFSYIFDVERINCFLKLVTLPQLLVIIIIFLCFIYVKQRKNHQKYENHLMSMHQQLKKQVQHKNQFQ